MADVVHAFMESPQFKRGALFIVYDEWGGFFDHVAPPRVPDIRNARHQQGLRADGLPHPGASPSRPTSRRGYVATTIYAFESILKMIEYRFGLSR